MTNYKELVKQRTSVPGYIEEVERFETWWNKNLATVISYYDSYWRVFLLVYDPVYSTYQPAKFPVDNSCNYWGYWGEHSRGKHNSSSAARSEVSWLRGELIYSWNKTYDNPILLIHPDCNYYRSFETFVTEPYVVKKYSTSYLKPFDVVKTDKTAYYHAGVYLGYIDEEFKVCHFTKDENNTTIDKWSKFLKGKVETYHPVIPFKNYRDIAGQIVWAKDNSFREGSYEYKNRNCEHLANMLVYGINYSEQVENKRNAILAYQGAGSAAAASAIAGVSIAFAPLSFGATLAFLPAAAAPLADGPPTLNNGKGPTIKLTNEISESDSMLKKKSDCETKRYEDKYLQEVPPKESCRIM